MDGYRLTEEIFLKDVKDHKISIIKEDGIYRHIRLARPETRTMAFEIVTWPGYLAYTGDMGDFIFSRTDDMFTFFRSKDGLSIDPGYWSEKVKAESVFGDGIRQFSVDEFQEAVICATREYFDLEENATIPDDILEELEPLLDADNKIECVSAMWRFDSDKIRFDDFWENTVTRQTWHYIWACYAIAWAVIQYDNIEDKP